MPGLLGGVTGDAAAAEAFDAAAMASTADDGFKLLSALLDQA